MSRSRKDGRTSPTTDRGAEPATPRVRPPTASPNPQPPPGHYLLAAIDTALHVLAAPAEPSPASALLAGDLRAALGHTAACGHTCRVHSAAADVRLAAHLLLAGSIEDARLVLQHARTNLADQPLGHR